MKQLTPELAAALKVIADNLDEVKELLESKFKQDSTEMTDEELMEHGKKILDKFIKKPQEIEIGTKYWCLTNVGQLWEKEWRNMFNDKQAKAIGNFYLSERQIKAKKALLLDIHRFKPIEEGEVCWALCHNNKWERVNTFKNLTYFADFYSGTVLPDDSTESDRVTRLELLKEYHEATKEINK